MKAIKVSLAALVFMGIGLARAEEKKAAGDAEAGKAYAKEVCAGCHSIEKGAHVSPNIKAPPFAVVAKSKLVTSREIDIWLQTAHPEMPDLLVPAGKRADLIAYIDSMK